MCSLITSQNVSWPRLMWPTLYSVPVPGSFRQVPGAWLYVVWKYPNQSLQHIQSWTYYWEHYRYLITDTSINTHIVIKKKISHKKSQWKVHCVVGHFRMAWRLSWQWSNSISLISLQHDNWFGQQTRWQPAPFLFIRQSGSPLFLITVLVHPDVYSHCNIQWQVSACKPCQNFTRQTILIRLRIGAVIRTGTQPGQYHTSQKRPRYVDDVFGPMYLLFMACKITKS